MFGKEEKQGTGDVAGLIGRGMVMEGKLTFEKTVRLDGRFIGEISGHGTLVVGEEGVVEAQVNVDTAIITGQVTGVLEAHTRVEIRSQGKVFGEIRTPNLIIGEGGLFEGNSVMLGKDKPARPYQIDFGNEKQDAAGEQKAGPV